MFETITKFSHKGQKYVFKYVDYTLSYKETHADGTKSGWGIEKYYDLYMLPASHQRIKEEKAAIIWDKIEDGLYKYKWRFNQKALNEFSQGLLNQAPSFNSL